MVGYSTTLTGIGRSGPDMLYELHVFDLEPETLVEADAWHVVCVGLGAVGSGELVNEGLHEYPSDSGSALVRVYRDERQPSIEYARVAVLPIHDRERDRRVGTTHHEHIAA